MGLRFQQDEYGLFVETDSFISGVPQQLLDLELPIRLVTLYDEGKTGDPTLGVHESEEITAVVDKMNRQRDSGSGFRSRYVNESFWCIRISGEEFEAVVALYRAFRQGKLELTEPWEDLPAKMLPLVRENERLRGELAAYEANAAMQVTPEENAAPHSMTK